MSRRLRLALGLAALLAVAPAVADDTDIIGTGIIEPNVMILLDSSGSMEDEVDGTPKITIAKQVVTSLISNTANVRFGVMKFRNHGGQMVAPIGTATAAIVTAVNDMTTTNVGTPLGDQLYDGGRYFKGTLPGYSSPIDLGCRPNVIIVVSDGLQNQSNRDLRDEATLRRTEDHATGLTGTQNVVVHTIGFAIDPDEEEAANDILQEAAANGGGSFYSTNNGPELEASLEEAVEGVVAGTFAFAGALVPSTSVTGNDKLYRASFLSDAVRPFWRGYLGAYQRDASGVVPTDGDGLPLDTARIWEAGAELASKTAASRTIYTVAAGVRHAFTTGNGAITAAMLGVATAGERSAVIDFTRGIDTFDEDTDANTSEERAWKLGDILHSRPVLIGPPVQVLPDPDHRAFKQAQAGRTTVLLVGANDGMLHAFQESDGEELWGFVPPDLLAGLKDLTGATGNRKYFVDSSPVAADIEISGAWRTIAMFGERRGGRSYHALDVTNTTDPGYLWSFTDARIGETWSIPAIGRIELGGGTIKDVAFVGGGYDTASNNASGKIFYVIDLSSGAKLWEYYNDGSGNDHQYMNYSIAAPPAALDLDGDGFVDRVYVGDVGGQLWKFDVSNPSTANWAGKRLFAAAPAQANPPPAGPWYPTQAIYAAPAASLDDVGDLWLHFGTGDLNHPLQASENRFYGLRDTTDMTNGSTITETSLANVTTTDGTGANGWYIILDDDEKVLATADIFDDTVFFGTFTPIETATCDGGAGPAKVYAVQATTGYAAIDWSAGEKLNPTGASQPRSVEVGSGIPGSPSVAATVVDGALDPSLVTGTTELQLDARPLPGVALREILYWREVD